MATVVFSTIGSALGGPAGGAIGALIGQSFDRQFLAPASHGPRLGDLSVQTSTYGTQIPRIYGTMRVAGTVVWATDLVESEQTSGAKGEPDLVYGYSVSLAVALSSRRVSGIGRIWADGKLLRGAAGDFKVPTGFRFYDGSEGQPVDPLICSIEGMGSTPAYRGLALVVFENLQLAEFGNRIPLMTFEVIGDADDVSVGAVLTDASAGAVAAPASERLNGYAAYGRSVASALQPLIDCFDVALFDDGTTIRPPAARLIVIDGEELGCSADAHAAPVIEREQLSSGNAPSTLRLRYYDPDRDYQTGEARAITGDRDGNESQEELAAVLSADRAKARAEQMLVRRWIGRERAVLRLPPSRLAIEPGATVEAPRLASAWVVEKCTVEGFVAVAELRPSSRPLAPLAADAGRLVANRDVVEVPATIALLDAPAISDRQANGPIVMLAASAVTPGWTSRAVTISALGQKIAAQSIARKSIIGIAREVLASAEPHLIDEVASLEVELVDPEQWLTSCTTDDLANGANAAIVGSELLQFATATSLGQGRFKLSRLLRGRGGTEWAIGGHRAGEPFCLVDSSGPREVAVEASLRGAELLATERVGGKASLASGAESSIVPKPVHLSAQGVAGELALRWIRRSRRGRAWLDEVDVPVGEAQEAYRVNLTSGSKAIEFETGEPFLSVTEADLTSLGAGPLTIEVRQLGDWGASRPAQLTMTL